MHAFAVSAVASAFRNCRSRAVPARATIRNGTGGSTATASRAVIAQAVSLASSSTASCNDQPTVGSWASQRYQPVRRPVRRVHPAAPASRRRDRRASRAATSAEATGRRSTATTVGAAAGAGPGDPGERRRRVERRDPCVPDTERADRVGDVTFDARHVELTVRADEPRLDQLAHGEFDVVVESFRVVGLDVGPVGRRDRASGTRRQRRSRRRARSPAPSPAVSSGRSSTCGSSSPCSIASPRSTRSCATNAAAAHDRAPVRVRPTCGAGRRPRSAGRS